MYSGPNMGGVESQTLEHVCNKTGVQDTLF